MIKRIICILVCFAVFLSQAGFCQNDEYSSGSLRVPIGTKAGKLSERYGKVRNVLEGVRPPAGKGAQKVHRIRFLLGSLAQELTKRRLKLNIEVYGVIHDFRETGLDLVVGDADFVTLELPNITVTNYFQKGPRAVKVWNSFWLAALRELRKKTPRGGVFGVNDSSIRYPRRRFHFHCGWQIGRGTYVPFGKEREYNLKGLGFGRKQIITGEELLSRLRPELRAEFQAKKVVHIPPQQNPFGKKHLVLFEPPSASLLQLHERLKKVLLEEFRDLGVCDEDILSIIDMHLIEPILCIYNDQDQIERMLERVRKSIRDHDFRGTQTSEQTLRLVHVSGLFHNPILQSYLTMNPSEAIAVTSSYDHRFCATNEFLVHPRFLESIEGILDHIYFSGNENEVEIDVEYFANLITNIVLGNKEFFSRKILLAAIRDEAHLAKKSMTEAGDVRRKFRKFGVDELTFEWSLVGNLLDDLSLEELKQVNAALEYKGRVYKTSPRWVLRMIINLGIMEPGEIAVFYAYRRLPQDERFMQRVYVATDRYVRGRDIAIGWFNPWSAYDSLEKYPSERKVEFQGEETTLGEVREKLINMFDDREIFVTVSYTLDESSHLYPAQITIGRRRHGPRSNIPSHQNPAGNSL